jgi:DNA-directed RNA polymerase specialized sigma24 family protein
MFEKNEGWNINIDSERDTGETFPWSGEEEDKNSFPVIDFDQEDEAVDRFIKSSDTAIFNKVYEDRIPSLQFWARRYYYLMDNSKEDLFSEFNLCFVKAVWSFKKDKGHFNTWLYYVLSNCIKNLYMGRTAKKRLPEGVDPNSMSKNILSLDFPYRGKDGDGSTLREALADTSSDYGVALNKLATEDTIDIISSKNPIVKGFLNNICEGNTVAALYKKHKMRQGHVKISKAQAQKLAKRKEQKKMVLSLIKNNALIKESFSVLNYSVVSSDTLAYTIEMKKTAETNVVMKAIRRLKKDKKNILAQINA